MTLSVAHPHDDYELVEKFVAQVDSIKINKNLFSLSAQLSSSGSHFLRISFESLRTTNTTKYKNLKNSSSLNEKKTPKISHESLKIGF